MPTHNVTKIYRVGAGTLVSLSKDYNANAEENLTDTAALTASITNHQFLLAFPFANIKALCITCDRNVVVKTNDATTPINTIHVKAGIPLIWTVDDGPACPITADVTSIYVSREGADVAVVGAANFSIAVVLGE